MKIMDTNFKSKTLLGILNNSQTTEAVLTLAHRVLRRAYFIVIGKSISTIRDIEGDLIRISINEIERISEGTFLELSREEKRTLEELVITLALRSANKLSLDPTQLKSIVSYLYQNGIPEIYSSLH